MPQQRPALDELVERYYRDWWDLFPSIGSRAGVHSHDAALETPSHDLLDHRRRQITKARAAVRELETPLPGSLEELDREVFTSHLVVSDLRIGAMQHWRRDPAHPLTEAVESLFELLMRRDVSCRDTGYAIAKRLAGIPGYLRAARERIDDPVGQWVAIAEQSLPGSVEFVQDATRMLADGHPPLAAELISAGQSAVEAIGEYGRWIAELRSKPLNGDVAVGPEVLTQLIKHWHGLDSSPAEVETLGWSLIQYYRDELAEQVKRIDRGASWNDLLKRAQSKFALHDRDMLTVYREVTNGLRDRMVGDGVLDLPPGERCDVIATPGFLRAMLPTAAYSNPGPLDPQQVGLFFVTEPDRSLGEEAYRANVGQHFGVEATCVHEAYPGHHVQLCWANRAASRARQLADHIIFMEGWTLYCEQWMVEQDWFGDPLLRINYLSDQLWRAYRMVIDVGVHTRSMSVAAAVQTLIDGVGFTRERAETELNWYTQNPGVPMSYMLGKRETLALRDAFLKTPGATLKRFHRWLLGFGSIPQRWLWAHLPHGGPGREPKRESRTVPASV